METITELQKGTEKSKNIISNFLMLLMLLIIINITVSKTPSRYEIVKDAKENTIASYNLYSKGFISLDGITKSNFREPLTIFVLATHIKLFTDIPKNISNIDEITKTPHYIKQINLANLYYIVLGFLLLWRLSWQLTQSNLFAATLILSTWLIYYIQPWYLGRPLPEYASSLLTLAIASLSVDLFKSEDTKKTLIISFFLGISIGLLSLTKAAALYVGVVFIPIVALYFFLEKKIAVKTSLTISAIAILGAMMVVSPWMLRNKQIQYITTTGEVTKAPLIASRGGAILLGRSQLNESISADPIGAAYAFSPPSIKKNLFEKYLNYQNADLWEGGKYESFNRNITFKKNPNDTAAKAIKIENDSLDMNKAKDKILHNVKDHLVSTFVLVWRGIWSFDGGNHLRPGGKTAFSIIFNFYCFLCFLILPLWAIFTKKHLVFISLLFPLGIFWIYAFASHFIPHYSAQLIPFALLSGLLVLRSAFNKIFIK